MRIKIQNATEDKINIKCRRRYFSSVYIVLWRTKDNLVVFIVKRVNFFRCGKNPSAYFMDKPPSVIARRHADESGMFTNWILNIFLKLCLELAPGNYNIQLTLETI